MPQIIVMLEESNKKENPKVVKLAKKWEMSKHDTIRKMIREYVE